MTDPDRLRRVISTSVGLTLGGVVHLLALFNVSRDLDRTATSGFFSGVYEVQARAFLDGHIAVPDGSLAIEGFVRDGSTYMYFPPWPALVRLPVLMTTHEFDGRLTLLSMALAWIVFVVFAAKLVWWLHERLTSRTSTTRGEGVLIAIFLAAASGGTFMTFDASLPWVYHEVYAWAIAASLGALYWLLRVITAPDWHAVRWLGAMCFVAIATRATSGWALCLTALAVGVWFALRRATPEHRRLWWGIVLAGAVPLALSIAYNLYKFDHVYMFPLQDQVWTQVNAHRREALEVNGGAITGPQFFTTAFHAYLWPTGIRFVDYFPWITLPARPPEALDGAFVDQAYRTGSATAFMPLFMLLQVVSTIVVFGPWAPPRARVLRVPMVAAVLITGGVMGYGYFAARYASEFVPALVLGGAIGTVLVADALRGRRVLPLAAGVVAVLATFSMAAQLAIGLSTAAVHARGQVLERYVAWQRDLSPRAQAALVTFSDSLDDDGRTDELRIVGDCDALYLNTGDAYEPWTTVQMRGEAARIRPAGRLRPGRVPLFRITGTQDTAVLEVTRERDMRFVLSGPDGEYGANTFEFPPNGYADLNLRNLTQYGFYEISAEPSGPVGFLRSTRTDDDWHTHPAGLTWLGNAAAARKVGVSVEHLEGLDMPLCEELAADAAAAGGS
ncbi:membrane hypothetical protein [metagenome]|uniref:Glycosyltransferase RgtA/B/C/D-like domain-containing protein n=1 Tax=metagenome TaxID=256318 RepID=A0A2P2CA67_9ZZZZ